MGSRRDAKKPMGRGKGKPLSPAQITKITTLLASTDMSISEIAERMGCSPPAVVAINKKLKIRLYRSKRSSWVINRAFRDDCA
jgi:DNA-binding MarR family transcriptional regulator